MEILEINKNKRSIVKITDDETRRKIGKDEKYEIDKLKYNVINQNERISISKLEAYSIQEALHEVGAFTKEINDLINVIQYLIDQISGEQSIDPK